MVTKMNINIKALVYKSLIPNVNIDVNIKVKIAVKMWVYS